MTQAEIRALHFSLRGDAAGNSYYGAGEVFNDLFLSDQYQAYLIFWQLVALSEGAYLG